MEAYCYCPKCGHYEIFDTARDDIRFDAERHCGKCGEQMVTRCPNEQCPQFFIESLNILYCPCGQKLPNIELATKKYKDSSRIKPRYIPGLDNY